MGREPGRRGQGGGANRVDRGEGRSPPYTIGQGSHTALGCLAAPPPRAAAPVTPPGSGFTTPCALAGLILPSHPSALEPLGLDCSWRCAHVSSRGLTLRRPSGQSSNLELTSCAPDTSFCSLPRAEGQSRWRPRVGAALTTEQCLDS